MASLRSEICAQLRLAVPIMLSNACQFSLIAASTMLSGHSGKVAKEELDGVALANSMVNAFGFSMAAGLATACDTLFSQGLGSDRPGRAGVFMQRAFILMNLFALLLTALHQNFEPIFVFVLNQDPAVAAVAAAFLRDFRFGIVFYFNYIVMARFLQSQGRVAPPLFAAVCGNVLNASCQGLLLALGAHTPRRTAICQASAVGLMLLILTLYLLFVFDNSQGAWSGFSSQALHSWGSFSWLAICGLFHNSLEVIYWEVGTVLAGMMSQTMLGAQAVLYLSETVLFTAQLGVSIVVNHRIGRALGSGDEPTKNARRIVKAGFCITGVLASCLFLLLVLIRKQLALAFTSDAEICAYVAMTLPLVGACVGLDGLESLLAGIIRGCGKQKIGALIVGCCFYLAGLPVSVLLAFTAKMRVLGLWLGTLTGVVLTTATYGVLLRKIDWEKEAEMARRRVEDAVVPQSEEEEEEDLDEEQPLIQRGEEQGDRRWRGLPKGLVMRRVVTVAVCVAVAVTGNCLDLWSSRPMQVIVRNVGPPGAMTALAL